MNNQPNIQDIACTIIKRQIARDCRGFLELIDFNLKSSLALTDEKYIEIEYRGKARLVQEAAVWTEQSEKIETILSLRHFQNVPTLDNYIADNNRIYQLWKAGKELPFTGHTVIYLTEEGWLACEHYRGMIEDSRLNAEITGNIMPDEYLIFSHESGSLVLTRSNSLNNQDYTDFEG